MVKEEASKQSLLSLVSHWFRNIFSLNMMHDGLPKSNLALEELTLEIFTRRTKRKLLSFPSSPSTSFSNQFE